MSDLEPRAEPNQEPNPQLTQPELIETPVDLGPAQPGARAARAPAVTFIFLTVMLDMLALGMIAPVLPRLIESFLHGDASATAQMLGLFGTVFAAMQFFFSPVLGSLSDRFGRRPIVLLSNFGLGADYLLMAWAPALPWLLVGRIISGVTASSIPTAMAYMADVTPHEKRAAAFGMLSSAFGVGFVVGPALGGLLGSVNPRLPFLVSAGLSLLNGLYGLFVLPESLSPEHRSPFSWKRANPIGSLAMLSKSRVLLLLSGLLLLGYLAQHSLCQVYVLYCDYRFGWSDPHRRPLAHRRRHLHRTLRRPAGQAGYGETRRHGCRSRRAWSAAPSATSASDSRVPACSSGSPSRSSTSSPSRGPPRRRS